MIHRTLLGAIALAAATCAALPAAADLTVTLEDGRTVLLRDDGTWDFVEDAMADARPCERFWVGTVYLEKLNDSSCERLNGNFDLAYEVNPETGSVRRPARRLTGEEACSVGSNLGWSCNTRDDGSIQLEMRGGAFGAYFVLEPGAERACGRDRWAGERFCVTKGGQ